MGLGRTICQQKKKIYNSFTIAVTIKTVGWRHWEAEVTSNIAIATETRQDHRKADQLPFRERKIIYICGCNYMKTYLWHLQKVFQLHSHWRKKVSVSTCATTKINVFSFSCEVQKLEQVFYLQEQCFCSVPVVWNVQNWNLSFPDCLALLLFPGFSAVFISLSWWVRVQICMQRPLREKTRREQPPDLHEWHQTFLKSLILHTAAHQSQTFPSDLRIMVSFLNIFFGPWD